MEKMSSITLGFVSTNMRKLKNTIMHPSSPRPKHRNEPVVPEKVLAKPAFETQQEATNVRASTDNAKVVLGKELIDDADNVSAKELGLDDNANKTTKVNRQASTLPRAKTETQINTLNADEPERAGKVTDVTIDIVDAAGVTSKVKLRRRISINPSWKAGSREVRRSRSFNTGSGSKDMEEHKPTGSPTYMRKRHKPLVVKKVPAKDLENNTISGYLERKCFNGQWVRYWYVLHEGTLFCYLTSDDNVTVDVLNLNGYSVMAMVDKFRGKRFVLQLSHENFTSLYLSMESREDLEDWQECLNKALGRPASIIRDDDDAQDNGACASCESNRREDVGEKAKKVKQKLLEEMLRQKHELERKQAERQKRQKKKDPGSPDRSPNTSFMNDFMTEEQRTSDVTRLRQRRLSTQLKMDTIQKQMVGTSNTKRGLFGFGKQKKPDENKNVFFQDQLKELSDKLNRIDTDLNQVKQDKIIDTFDVNQNKQQVVSSGFDAVDGIINENSEVFDSDGMGRTNSVKSRMQKLTNKTFSKNSVKNKKRSKSPHSGSVPNLTSKQNGDIVNGHEYELANETHSEDCLSSDSSVTDLTRPASDLTLELLSSQNGSNSPTSSRYDRSNSRTSTLSNLSSPRREINPSVLAEIDAFEELSRQVLSARSKELPTK